MTTWPSPVDVTPNAVMAIQSDLTVRLIMTERTDVMTCQPTHTVDRIMARNVEQFSVLPVEVEGRINGLYRADQWFGVDDAPCLPIGDDFERLTEDHLIGIDGSILEFLNRAAEHPTRLVVSGGEIVGLVCLADIQKLPVRAAIFGVVTALEMAMCNCIETTWIDDPAGWLDLLSEGRRRKLEGLADKAKEDDMFVSYLVLSQFADKATIVRKQGLVDGTKSQLSADFRSIRKLRDRIAHSNPFGETYVAAQEVCRTVTRTLSLLDELSSASTTGQLHGDQP